MRVNYKNLMNLRKIASEPKKLFVVLIFLALAILFNSFAIGVDSLDGKVIRVTDGDTITLLDKNGKKHTIRFYGIDAPETTTNQPFGIEAKDFLASMIEQKTVKVIIKDKDKYDRIVGVVEFNGKDINKIMVQNGFAWAYSHYTEAYLSEHRQAKKQKLGLWADKKPIEPYKWRKTHDKKVFDK